MFMLISHHVVFFQAGLSVDTMEHWFVAESRSHHLCRERMGSGGGGRSGSDQGAGDLMGCSWIRSQEFCNWSASRGCGCWLDTSLGWDCL